MRSAYTRHNSTCHPKDKYPIRAYEWTSTEASTLDLQRIELVGTSSNEKRQRERQSTERRAPELTKGNWLVFWDYRFEASSKYLCRDVPKESRSRIRRSARSPRAPYQPRSEMPIVTCPSLLREAVTTTLRSAFLANTPPESMREVLQPFR